MLIIEGPDGAGKTTLAKKLSEDLGIDLSKYSRLTQEERNKLSRAGSVKPRVYGALGVAVAGRKDPVIHDRMFFSELVYGQVLRGSSVFSFQEERMVLDILHAMGVPVIFCLPPVRDVYDNLGANEQMEGVRENIDKIYKGYEALAGLARPKPHVYDYTRGPAAYARILGVCVDYVANRRRRM